MIKVRVVYQLSDGYVVEYNKIRYILTQAEIFYSGPQAYTYPDKLKRLYREYQSR